MSIWRLAEGDNLAMINGRFDKNLIKYKEFERMNRVKSFLIFKASRLIAKN